MAVPFRRTSKTKKRMRRTHLKKAASTITTCPNCGAAIKPHRMCTKCGFYKGREVAPKLEVEETKEKTVKKAATKKVAKAEVKKEKVAKKTTKKETKKAE